MGEQAEGVTPAARERIRDSGESIHLKDVLFNAYLARPEREGKFPVLVIIHELPGMSDDMRRVARQYAEQGYVALALDLYSHRTANRWICLLHMFRDLWLDALKNSCVRDLKEALTWLQQQDYVDGRRLGAVGFCMGGGYALAWACADKRLQCIAPYYAFNPWPPALLGRACPVIGTYPANDRWKTASARRTLEMTLTLHKVPHDIKVYPNTDHAFYNEVSNPLGTYNAEAAADSFQRVLAFFSQHLVG